MSTKFKSNLVATTLVVLMLALGSVFGYAVLGGNHKAPAHADAPQEQGVCTICGNETGGGSGGNVPPLPSANIGGGGIGGTR